MLSKTARLHEVVAAVRRLRAGEMLIPLDEVIELSRFAGRERERELDEHRLVDSLTVREREVLQLLADGLDGRGIAARLHISLRTQRNHVTNILAKLGVHSPSSRRSSSRSATALSRSSAAADCARPAAVLHAPFEYAA